MGTPDFAVAILDKLLQEDFNIVAVITAPDKPAGRGRKLNESSVKKYAAKNNLPILQPKNLKNEDFINQLTSLKPDLQIVVAFRMLPKVVWKLPKLGTFNLHASLLPEYRGAAPIHWAIINGEIRTGVTTFFIDDKIDTGEIILSSTTNIEPDETVGSLHDKLIVKGSELVCKTVDLIAAGKAITKKQPNVELKPAPKLTPENTKINWSESTDVVYNKIRGLNPFPSAWTEIMNGDKRINAKIYAVKKDVISHTLEFGTLIFDKKTLKIATRDGFIHILEIKLAGKKKMDAKRLLNGFHFQEKAKAL